MASDHKRQCLLLEAPSTLSSYHAYTTRTFSCNIGTAKSEARSKFSAAGTLGLLSLLQTPVAATPVSYLRFYHPCVWPLSAPRVVDVGRIHRDAMVFVVQRGVTILVFVNLAYLSCIWRHEFMTWRGVPEEKLGARLFKRSHYFTRSRHLVQAHTEEERNQKHRAGLVFGERRPAVNSIA